MTRVSVGVIQGGTARNAIPAEVRLSGEVRTLAAGGALQAVFARIERAFTDAAARSGGSAECAFEPHGSGYEVPADEPLLLAWRDAWRSVGCPDAGGITSFIGSDTNALRQRLRVFTVSTGVEDEHTAHESIALAPLADLVLATQTLLARTSDAVPAPRLKEEFHV